MRSPLHEIEHDLMEVYSVLGFLSEMLTPQGDEDEIVLSASSREGLASILRFYRQPIMTAVNLLGTFPYREGKEAL